MEGRIREAVQNLVFCLQPWEFPLCWSLSFLTQSILSLHHPLLSRQGSRSEFINIYCRGSFLRGLRFGVGFYGYRAAIRGERRWKEDCLLCASLWDELHTIVQWNDASVTQQESEWDGPTNRTLAYQPSCLLLFSLNQQRLSAGSGGWQWIYFCPEDDFGGLFVQQVDIFWFGLSKLNIHFK